MPTISMFYGIIIRIYYEDHRPPHFHAYYQGHKALFDFEGDIMSGEMPLKQQRLIAAWAQIHQEELEANWVLAAAKEAMMNIDPLR